jgi:hypothetical protein
VSSASTMSSAVLRRFAEFLETLSEEQVSDLAEGRAELSCLPLGRELPVQSKPPRRSTAKAARPTVDAVALVHALEGARSLNEGRDRLDSLTVADLLAVAAAAGMTGVSRTKRADLIEQIVGLLVGGRLAFAAIREQ